MVQDEKEKDKTLSSKLEIYHTQDLIALIANGTIAPSSPLPLHLENPATRAVIKSISSPFKAKDEPYQSPIANGLRLKATFLDKKGKEFAPHLAQLPGPKKISRWLEEKFFVVPCRICGQNTIFIQLVVITPSRVKAGFYSIECGIIRLDNLEEKDFLLK